MLTENIILRKLLFFNWIKIDNWTNLNSLSLFIYFVKTSFFLMRDAVFESKLDNPEILRCFRCISIRNLTLPFLIFDIHLPHSFICLCIMFALPFHFRYFQLNQITVLYRRQVTGWKQVWLKFVVFCVVHDASKCQFWFKCLKPVWKYLTWCWCYDLLSCCESLNI